MPMSGMADMSNIGHHAKPKKKHAKEKMSPARSGGTDGMPGMDMHNMSGMDHGAQSNEKPPAQGSSQQNNQMPGSPAREGGGDAR
jgi:hypothetical protein